MPNPAGAYYDDGLTFWDDGSTYDSAIDPAAVLLTSSEHIPLNSTAMEYWEITKQRAQETLPVWTQYLPTFKVAGQGTAELTALIDGFEPLVQGRTDAQDTYDAAFRAAQDALLRMKGLGTKVPAIIEAHLDENAGIMKDVDDLYATATRSEGTILKRLRELLPVWTRANTVLAAQTPAQDAIVRTVGGVSYTVVSAKALLDGYTNLVKTMKDKEELLDRKRAELRAHDRAADQLNKRWYKAVKASNDPGSDVYEALNGITTEPTTPAPETIEIHTITQGGDGGLQVLVAYAPGGGAHATTKLVKWQVVGVDADFTHSTPLDPSGNALGPFQVGQTLKILTETTNSSGTRTTAPRTIVIVEPVV
ncbi:MAG: hypothetical protein ACKVY0_29020 [Prosthecobacter sp.]|uniref:hypothetical protein n=1 Tax=Prosthecobacter sp. TaxID=1965333 RepID=UPI0039045507